jgi:hypothetical protein
LSTNSETKKGDLIDVLFNGSVYKKWCKKGIGVVLQEMLPIKTYLKWIDC